MGVLLALAASAAVADSGAQTWSKAGDLPGVQQGATLTALTDGRALEAGGEPNLRIAPTTQEPSLATSFVFDAHADAWKRVADMPQGHSNASAVLLPDGEVLVIGGYSDFLRTTTATVALFDPKSSTWRQVASLKQSRAEMAATGLSDGRVLVTGGIVHEALPNPQTGSGLSVTLTSSSELFDPRTGAWSPAASMPSPRADHVATLLSNGRVLVVGGTSDGTNQVAATIEYDPSRNVWIKLPPLLKALGRAAVVTMADGRPLVVGDYGHLPSAADLGSPPDMGAIAEILDESSGTWSPAQSPPTQAFFSAQGFLLPGGGVLFLGLDQNQTRGFIYDSASDRWSLTPAYPVSVIYLPAAVQLTSGDLLVVMGNLTAQFGSTTAAGGRPQPGPQANWLQSSSTAFALTAIAVFLMMILGLQRLRLRLVNAGSTGSTRRPT